MPREIRKISGNASQLIFAQEETPGVLPGSPVFFRLKPNAYGGGFGATYVSVEDDTISPDGIPEKTTITDQDASAGPGFNMSFTNPFDRLMENVFQSVMHAVPTHGGIFNLTPNLTVAEDAGDADVVKYDLDGTNAATAGYLAGQLLFAEGFTNPENNGLKHVAATSGDFVEVDETLVVEASPPNAAKITVVGMEFAAADISVVHDAGTLPSLLSAAPVDFSAVPLLRPGLWVYITGLDNPENNGLARIIRTTTDSIVFDQTSGGTDGETEMSAEVGTGDTVQIFFGDMVRRHPETGAQFVERSHYMEQYLGRPAPTAEPTEIQGQSVTGGFINTVTINLAQGDKVTAELEFLAFTGTPHTGETGVDVLASVGGTVLDLPAANIYNATSHVLSFAIRELKIESLGLAANRQVVEDMTGITLTISNGANTTKSIGTFGAFGVNIGVLTAALSGTAYHVDVVAQQLIESNADVTSHILFGNIFQGRTTGLLFDFCNGSLSDGRPEVARNSSITVPLTLNSARHATFNFNFSMQRFHYLPI